LAQFVELFHPYDYIYRPVSGGTWASANEKWKLTDTEIIKAIACANESFYIGTRSGKRTRYAVLDIDASSKYHNKPQLDRLLHALSKAGLTRSSLFRSSSSGGWHLYIFFEEHINSALLHRQLVSLLKLSDFEVAKGTLEVFPHPGTASKGMGLRLPLQHGWAWLSKRDLEVEHERYEMTATKALEWFLDLLDSDANPTAAFKQMVARIGELEKRKSAARAHGINDKPDNVVQIRKSAKVALESEYSVFVGSVFGHIPSGMNAENWNKGRTFHKDGLTGPSQRAEAIFCLGHYFFYGDPSRNLPALGYGFEEERNWAIKEYLEARHNGYSSDINRGRTDATAQVDRATNWRPAHKKSVEPKRYSAVRPISWVRENANRKSDARKRIQDALAGIKKLQRSFTTVELQKAAKCSRETLYAHQDLWRADYEDLAAGFFAICTDEYNAVVEAACSESKPPSTVSQKITPPGLLAARRIVYELSMRTKRDIQTKKKVSRVSFEGADKEWRDKVASLTGEVSFDMPVPKLKSYLLVLANYLSLAPCEEDALPLQGFISRIRRELSSRSHGPEPPLFCS
jgi:hypothetical protein